METTESHSVQRGLPPGERAMRLDRAPRRSLVVAAAGPRDRLESLLGALLPSCMQGQVELVVARACSAEEYRALATAFPAVLFMPAPDNSNRRQLRAIGLTAADGDVVTLLDDDRSAADALARLEPAPPAGLPSLVSVIVPAHDALASVRPALEALVASDLPRDRFELLLIDDGSIDETSMTGAEYCDCVVRLAGRPKGPAFARNRGAEIARGHILVFVDVDVVAHPDALRRLAARLDDPAWTAVFGSYDEHPTDPGFVSQYRNLLHTWMHQRNRGASETFWAALAGIRRSEFFAVGMFDEWHYGNPQIEDIELGKRLRRHGHGIVCDPDACGTHLKRWTFRGTLLSDLHQRGVPEMWLQLADRSDTDRSLFSKRSGEQLLATLAALAIAMPLLALVLAAWWPLMAGAAITLVIVIAHASLYAFLARLRGPVFALAAVPMHLLYLAGNAVSVVYGWASHHLFGEPIPSAEVNAHAQMGIETWPPPPKRSRHSVWEAPQPKQEPAEPPGTGSNKT